MKKRIVTIITLAVFTCVCMAGCSKKEKETTTAAETVTTETQEVVATVGEATSEENKEADASATDVETVELEDGVYTVDFDTDSSMFHVNETCEGKGTLTVEKGVMTLHITLPSKNIVNLYPGLAEDAAKENAEILEPTMDTVTYEDGMSEEVHGFDVPVPYVGPEFDLALIGSKGIWYDHKVSVSNPVLVEE